MVHKKNRSKFGVANQFLNNRLCFDCNFVSQSFNTINMTHDFSNLTALLSRCNAKMADAVISEIRAAVNDAAQYSQSVNAAVTRLSFNVKKAKKALAEERAAVRAAKKAEKTQTETQTQTQTQTETQTQTSPSQYVNGQMAGYIKRCSEQNIQDILNCYIHLLLTGNILNPADDSRYFNNFLLMAKAAGFVTDGTAITEQQIDDFVRNNPVFPLNRAQRRRLERFQRKHKR